MGCSCDDRSPYGAIGNIPEGPVGSEAHVEEVRGLGAWYDGEFGLDRQPHADGVVERVLGRPLPVLVFGMARPGREAHATEAANPPELTEDFRAWLRAVGEI
ncbi:hypothetical protein [Streptomyces werraensis]|uniref:hypothetical protein n=1 Tax=Streptomyces werraensis TaxID=68284 RepID=UPI00368316C6